MFVHPPRHLCVAATAVTICLAWPARAGRVTESEFFSTVNDMLVELAPRSVESASLIRSEYRPYVDPLVLDDFTQIEHGLATGGLVPLPLDPQRFNVRVRLEGTSPIGEMDIEHQESYVAARPATIGCLLDVASRVKSGPLEVTSLVRHLDYQEQLRATNPNATTDVPTHALGLAFDIAIVNTPLETVLEIRDVLQQMSDAGEILVIAERHQLVFHVVPQPSRLGWYQHVYARAITGQSWGEPGEEEDALFTPVVTTAISSLQPLPAWAAEWWAADNVPVDLPISVNVVLPSSVDVVTAELPEEIEDTSTHGVTNYITVLGELLSSTWRWISPWDIG